MRAYNGSNSSTRDPYDLSVNVLSMGNWPSYPEVNVQIPAAMARSLERFKAFYVGKHSGRTLKWQHSLDFCSLKAAFPKGGKKELVVSLFQALVLLLFNDVPVGGKLSFDEIVEGTRIGELSSRSWVGVELIHCVADVKDAARTLQSLACGKVRVLQKIPKGKEVATTDQFVFNDGFRDDHVKIKINQIQQKETVRTISLFSCFLRGGLLRFGCDRRRRTSRRATESLRIELRTSSWLSSGAFFLLFILACLLMLSSTGS